MKFNILNEDCSDEAINCFVTEKAKEERWNSIHLRVGIREDIKKQYDGWLEFDERISNELKKCSTPILDLGCGVGIDTLHLIEMGHEVVACDFSNVAIEKVKENIPEARVLQFNMKNNFPFDKESFEFIIANKSIHYFSESETKQIVSELHRILKVGGKFAFVVNSTNDSNFGAGQGILLEENFYEVRGTTKRFFNKESLEMFFESKLWEFIYMKEDEAEDERIKTVQLNNDSKANKKITWTCMVKKK